MSKRYRPKKGYKMTFSRMMIEDSTMFINETITETISELLFNGVQIHKSFGYLSDSIIKEFCEFKNLKWDSEKGIWMNEIGDELKINVYKEDITRQKRVPITPCDKCSISQLKDEKGQVFCPICNPPF